MLLNTLMKITQIITLKKMINIRCGIVLQTLFFSDYLDYPKMNV